MSRTCSTIFILFTILVLSAELSGQAYILDDKDSTGRRICLLHFMTEKNVDKFPSFIPDDVYRESYEMHDEAYFIVPVVIHVIHDGGPENLSDELLKSQIAVLNEDFGNYGIYNDDPRGKDSRIRFCLAKRDPDGMPTTGIVRIQSPLCDLKTDVEMETKNLSRWDQHRYLNIWVVRSIDGSSNIQGYAYMPRNAGGPIFHGDGIVMTYRFFGRGGNFDTRYNYGRTCTHEAGHYFDLMHTWGGDDFSGGKGNCDDDDGIFDTPNCSLDFYADPKTGCQRPSQCGYIRMTENFLDYSLDLCMKLFTKDQGEKMRYTIRKYRRPMVAYENLIACGCGDIYDSLNSNTRVSIYPIPASEYLIIETHFTQGKSDLEFHIYDLYGRHVISKFYPNTSKFKSELSIHDLRPGIYYITGSFAGEAFRKKFIVI